MVQVPETFTIISNGLITSNSQNLHALGLDVFSYAIDEVNFMYAKLDKDKGASVGQAYEIYNTVYSRILSRFLRPGGSIPGIMLLMSSRNAQTSFLEEHMKKVKDKPTTYISDYALWDVKDPEKFGKKVFFIEVGDRLSQSRFIDAPADARDGAKVVKVPSALRMPFEEDIDQALRDHAGVATFNVSPLIRDRQSIPDAFRESIPFPFSREIIQIGTEQDDLLDDYFVTDRACKVIDSKFVPRLNPAAPRAIHLDLSLSGDCAGIGMGHIAGLVRREKVQPDGTVSKVTQPFIVMDILLKILPPLSGEIDLSKIRTFIRYLSRYYSIFKVTTDGFQSADMRQILKKMKFESQLLSVDRTADPYLSLRAAHFERRIVMYPYPTYEREMLDLERDIKTNKVDHPTKASDGTKGSKDVSDCAAGVTWTLITDHRASRGAKVLDLVSDRPSTGVKALDPDDQPDLRDERHIGGQELSWSGLRANVNSSVD